MQPLCWRQVTHLFTCGEDWVTTPATVPEAADWNVIQLNPEVVTMSGPSVFESGHNQVVFEYRGGFLLGLSHHQDTTKCSLNMWSKSRFHCRVTVTVCFLIDFDGIYLYSHWSMDHEGGALDNICVNHSAEKLTDCATTASYINVLQTHW